ncbi:hypothetical protein SNE35_15140 [Paucibacter sp. R3-3]|uniref:Uncharacterized protein n=1 Tax=Roseateles agri TaxID=3098619 RepID=A0ABU5DI69_9BURK|nr:hypothetical protein [Paucibacter sp. R3-3]MDY0745854.1 hypothetical protein [Paucibacter sp. R3-3]
MKKFKHPSFAAALAIVVATAAHGATHAQTAAKPAATKPAAAKPAAKAKPKATKPVPPPPPPLPEADEAQLAAAERAYLGTYDCEFKQTIHISKDTKDVGYIDVALGKQTFVMKPVLSSTGALRLEDVTGKTLMIQIANKSMLLDVKLGQRLVDDCISPQQRELIAAMAAAKAAAAASGVAPDVGLGIDPQKTAAAAAAASAAANAAASAASAAVKAAAVAASAAEVAASAASAVEAAPAASAVKQP